MIQDKGIGFLPDIQTDIEISRLIYKLILKPISSNYIPIDVWEKSG
jgi:hypothetical protein